MAKAYWVVCYRSISDPAARDAYTKLAVPAVLASGGRFLARGLPAKTYEGGIDQRTVLVEFDSLAQAIAAHESPGYQAHWLSLAMRRSVTYGWWKVLTDEPEEPAMTIAMQPPPQSRRRRYGRPAGRARAPRKPLRVSSCATPTGRRSRLIRLPLFGRVHREVSNVRTDQAGAE